MDVNGVQAVAGDEFDFTVEFGNRAIASAAWELLRLDDEAAE